MKEKDKTIVHTTPLFNKHQKLKLQDQYTYNLCKLGLNIYHDMAPVSLNSLLTRTSSRTHHLYKVHVPTPKINNDFRQVDVTLPNIWNNLLYSYKDKDIKPTLKMIKNSLLFQYRKNLHCTRDSCTECNPSST